MRLELLSIKRIFYGVVIFTALFVFTVGPAPAQTAKAPVSLKVALLPILDSFPCYVAQEAGFFKEKNIEVVIVPVASGLDRDQLMQSGEIDGMLNEMTTTAFFNQKRPQVKIVSVARTAFPDSPLFRILAAPGSNIRSAADLAGVPVGVAKNTIIEYVTERLLTARGLAADQIRTQSVPVIPERYQLVMQGQLKAATLPDPLAKSALEAGALNVVDDSAYPKYAVSVLSFSTKALETKGAAVRAFVAAWDRAAARINADPAAQRPLLLKKIRVPPNVQETYAIPRYPRKSVPAPAQWADVMDWMLAKKLLQAPLAYPESVTDAFLP